MGVFNKLFTLSRSAARESAQVLLDANALRLFEQEIVDVEQVIQSRKQAMSEVIVARKQVEREIAALEHMLEKRESQAAQLIKNNKAADLVADIAAEIADFEDSLEALQCQHQGLQQRIKKMEIGLQKALHEVMRYRRDLRLAKAQQVSCSGLAKANNLPKQLGELEQTRDHVAALQSIGDDRDTAWDETQERIRGANIEGRLKAQGADHKAAHIKQVLDRLHCSLDCDTAQ